MQTAVVTGTSTGIGYETTLTLARRGYRVFAGMRNLGKADPLRKAAEEESLPIEVIELDVTSDDSVAGAFAKVTETGPVDVLVNNAGIGGATPLELTPDDEHRAIFETNYFGTVRCIQAVIKSMRERGAGTIVNVSSITGLYATPNQIAYSASKWAVECLGEALAVELRRFGVRVVLIEPGVIMTNIFDNSAEATRYDKHSPYQPIMRWNGKLYAAGFQQATQPSAVADAIIESVTTDDYRLRWPVGPDAEGFTKGQPLVSAEDRVALGDDLADDEYKKRFLDYFGIQL